MSTHDHMFVKSGWDAECVHCNQPRHMLIGEELHKPPVVTREDIAKDIMAKVADLNEAIELAAGAGLVTFLELNRVLTLQGSRPYDVPMLDCLITARL